MKVENMTNGNGNQVPNQFIITKDGKTVFQSYKTVIAENDGGKIILDPDWNFSRTTSKYRCLFLGENTQATRDKIKSGEYEVKGLN